MQKNLYLVCPLSFSEHYLQKTYGTHHFFLTALGSVFRFNELRFIEKLVDFLACEPVEHITVVHDLNCPLKNKVIGHSKDLDSFSEKQLFDLYIDHYYQINGFESNEEKVRQLALTHIESLSQRIENHPMLQGLLHEQGIEINGLLLNLQTEYKEYTNPYVSQDNKKSFSTV